MSSEQGRPAVPFEPLRPASRGRLVAGFVFGPILWLVALVFAALVLEHTDAIVLGTLVTVAAFLISLVVLSLLFAARRRQERRYADDR